MKQAKSKLKKLKFSKDAKAFLKTVTFPITMFEFAAKAKSFAKKKGKR